MLTFESEEPGLLTYDFGTETDLAIDKYSLLRPWQYAACLLGNLSSRFADCGVALSTKKVLDAHRIPIFGDVDWVEPTEKSVNSEKPLIVAGGSGTLLLPANKETLFEASFAIWLSKGSKYQVFSERAFVLKGLSRSPDLLNALSLTRQLCLVTVEPDFAKFEIKANRSNTEVQGTVKAAIEEVNKRWS